MAKRRAQLRSLLRLTPFTLATEYGRSQERYRRVLLTALSGILSKAIAFLTTLLSVPLTVHYLGTERFGLWMTISSLTALASFADLGTGSGLVIALSEINEREDRELEQTYVSSGFFVLLAIAALVVALLVSLYSYIPWATLFNVRTTVAQQEAGPAAAVFLISVALNIPLGIVQRVQVGRQEGFKTQLWNGAGWILGFLGVLLTIRLRGGLQSLVFAWTTGPILATLANWILQFSRSRPYLFPQWRHFDSHMATKLAHLGSLFFLQQIFGLMTFATDSLIIARTLGANAVAGYAVVQKLFATGLIVYFFITPLWPAFSEATARRDYAWARRTLNRALSFSVGIGVAASLPLLIFGKWIIGTWVSADLVPSTALLAGFALWTVQAGFIETMNAVLNNGRLLAAHLVPYGFAAIAALVLKIVLVGKWHSAGVVWASVFAFGTLHAVPALRRAYGLCSTITVERTDTADSAQALHV